VVVLLVVVMTLRGRCSCDRGQGRVLPQVRVDHPDGFQAITSLSKVS
jgi:hypothetical protein